MPDIGAGTQEGIKQDFGPLGASILLRRREKFEVPSKTGAGIFDSR